MRLAGRRRAYILTFDRDDLRDYKVFHDTLAKTPEVITWWHYIKSSYIIISKHSANVLAQEILKIAPNKRLLIVEVNLKNRNGLLPKEAWEWLTKQQEFIE